MVVVAGEAIWRTVSVRSLDAAGRSDRQPHVDSPWSVEPGVPRARYPSGSTRYPRRILVHGKVNDMRARILTGLLLAGAVAGCASETPGGETTTATPLAAETDARSGDGDVSLLSGRLATLVVDTRVVGSARYVTVDPVQFLTGEVAAEASGARGDESPPPNDFYILNDDPALHNLPVAAEVMVAMVMDAQGASCPEMACAPLPLTEWAAAVSGPAADVLRSTPYWMTVQDGTVTAIEQQYIP